jgi:hypothetical protein
MAWPTGKPDTTKFDSQDDSISGAQPELQTMSTSVGQMVDFLQPSGIADGQVLVYDNATDTMIPGNAGGGQSHISTVWSEFDLDSSGNLEITPDNANNNWYYIYNTLSANYTINLDNYTANTVHYVGIDNKGTVAIPGFIWKYKGTTINNSPAGGPISGSWIMYEIRIWDIGGTSNLTGPGTDPLDSAGQTEWVIRIEGYSSPTQSDRIIINP